MQSTAQVNRTRASRALLVVTFVLSLLTGPLMYASSIINEPDRFVEVTDRIIDHPSVRRAIAEEVTTTAFTAFEADEVVADVLPDQARSFAVPITRIATDQLTDAAFAVLDTDIAVDAREAAARELHSQLTSDDETVVIDLRALLVRTTREIGGATAGAAVAKVVSGQDVGRYVVAEAGSTEAEVIAAIRDVPALSAAIWFAMVGVFFLAVMVAEHRRRALVVGGLVLAGGALVGVFALAVVVYLVAAAVDGSSFESGLGYAVAESLTADFTEQQRGAILGGLGLSAVGMLLGNRPAAVALRSLPRAFWHRDRAAAVRGIVEAVDDNPPLARLLVWLAGAISLQGWPNPTVRVLVTIVAITVAVQMAIWLVSSPGSRASRARDRVGIDPNMVVLDESHTGRMRTNVVVGAVALLVFWPAWGESLFAGFFTVSAGLLALVDARAARRYSTMYGDMAEPAIEMPVRRRRRTLALVGGFAAVVVAALLTAGSEQSVAADAACNGSEALCALALDEVVFAGSHNSMSSTDLGWDLAMQTGDIIAQLDHGIRALLIDTHYWDRGGTVEGGDDSGAAALIEASLADDEPRPGTWLCHGFCALGATDYVAALADINIWLDEHPREVLMIVVQDETSLEDTLAGFTDSGLFDKVYDHQQGEPWPTLGQMIEDDQRVVVYGENGGSADSWFENAWESGFTETPFNFGVSSDFSCEPNRGDVDNPFFLVNHWVTTGIPVREVAARINSADELLARVRACEGERGRPVSVVAVDFAQTGDLVEVVAELNSVGD